MDLSIIVPVLNEQENLPYLFQAIEEQMGLDKLQIELIFVDNGSEDDSLKLLKKFQAKHSSNRFFISILKESERGFASPINRGIQAAQSEKIAITDADTAPHRRWTKTMHKELGDHLIVVGETLTKLSPWASASEKYSHKIFNDFTQKAVRAEEHPLPWGPTCNLGLQKSVWQRVGAFSRAAGSAFDIDWCWRAILKGYSIHYSEKARVDHYRRTRLPDLLRQMHRYGAGEAWLAKEYDFLVNPSAKQTLWQKLSQRPTLPFKSGLRALVRMQKKTSDLPPSQQLRFSALAANIAFSAGVVRGHFQRKKTREKSKSPAKPNSLMKIEIREGRLRLFHPKKGLIDIDGIGSSLWEKYQQGQSKEALEKHLMEEFAIDTEHAKHEVANFLEAMEE